jgi:hypothetical protein
MYDNRWAVVHRPSVSVHVGYARRRLGFTQAIRCSTLMQNMLGRNVAVGGPRDRDAAGRDRDN